MRKIDRFLLLFLSLCCLFVVLCTIHYLRGRPLWLDEISVFKSVQLNSTEDFFTKPLQVAQIFPRLYLCVIQKIAQPFDLSVWGVRLLPYLSMLLAFALWMRIGRLALKDNIQYLVFVLCWTASIPLIYYSAELKQYSMDVLVSGCFVLFLYNQTNLARSLSRSQYTALLMALPLLGLFSYPAFIFMAFPLYNMLREKQKSWMQILLYISVCLMVLAALYAFDLRISKANADTQGFNDYAISFQSFPEFLRTWWEGTMNLFSRWFTEQPRWMKKVGLVFMVLGIGYIPWAFFHNWTKGNRQLSSVELLAFPLYIELVILGALKKYPFTVPRTSLFYCPITFLMTLKALDLIKTYHRDLYRFIMAAFVIFLLVVAVGIAKVVMTKDLGSICFIW